MITLHVRNVNEALVEGLHMLKQHGVREDSRDGPVTRYPGPVTTVYSAPNERVLFAPWRDANPFFHLVEAMWMLAGRDTLKDLTPYVKRMSAYSDDGGKTQPAAYGRRWRGHFRSDHGSGVIDQLDWVVQRLRANPGDRRAVIGMWDVSMDPEHADENSKDVPCNLTALPWVEGGHLHLTVFCRSNDIIMGAYGANAVHFSVLLEYLAGRLGLAVGTYTQVSNNYHAYERDLTREDISWGVQSVEPYEAQQVDPYPMFTDWPISVISANANFEQRTDRMLQEDLAIFFEHGAAEAAKKARWPFLRRVVVPMALAHKHYRTGQGLDRYLGAVDILGQCQASDWRRAGTEWIQRRQAKFINKEHTNG